MHQDIQQLFGGAVLGDAEVRRLSVLMRHGQPLLYLPRKRGLALQALTLYPAQRPIARMARRILRLGCSAGLAPLLPTTTLSVPATAPLSRFLTRLTGGDTLPSFAILAGNPQAEGRRFILLVFDAAGRCAFVVKAGVSPQATALIDREAAVLEAIESHAFGVPRLQAVHRTQGLHALALEYAEGNAPTATEPQRMAAVLGSWVNTERRLQTGDVPAWQRLFRACPEHPVLRQVRRRLEGVSFHPVLYHGDFAPWNVKVASDGSWQVLDWERGERVGMPCWDWFHWEVQVGLLVRRLSPEAHARRVDERMSREPFRDYADRAGVAEVVRELFLAYLLYSMKIIGPSQSLPAKRDLLDTLVPKWISA
jgi:hypothetical protein